MMLSSRTRPLSSLRRLVTNQYQWRWSSHAQQQHHHEEEPEPTTTLWNDQLEAQFKLMHARTPVPISLQHFPVDALQMADFLRLELPVRLAHRIDELQRIPVLSTLPNVQYVQNIYRNSFRELINVPEIVTPSDEQQFRTLLLSLYQHHSCVMVEMAKGAYELREQRARTLKLKRRRRFLIKRNMDTSSLEHDHNNDSQCELSFEKLQYIHHFLDRFYMSRIGIRFLAGHYLALHSNSDGLICPTTSPYECIRLASSDATMLCRRTYGRAPFVEIEGNYDLQFPYIPTYLRYILLELLKNALRATMEQHQHSHTVPSVNVIIADGTEDIVIKITDQGGGIKRSQINHIWSYLFTTADPNVQKKFLNSDCTESPMAGLGYGLPISRSYCRYFGGDLDLLSMEGYGTDAWVHLKRIGDSEEPVPV